MRTGIWIGAALTLASACARSTSLEGTAKPDGSAGMGGAPASARLQPWQLEAEGAPPLRVGILDTKTHKSCRFRLDAAGTLRCFPEPIVEQLSYFADAACTRPVLRGARAHHGRPR